MHHVAVADDVVLSFEPQLPRFLRALLAGAVMALIAMESRSRAMLVMGEVFASAALATIVICEKLSLWALPYLE